MPDPEAKAAWSQSPATGDSGAFFWPMLLGGGGRRVGIIEGAFWCNAHQYCLTQILINPTCMGPAQAATPIDASPA